MATTDKEFILRIPMNTYLQIPKSIDKSVFVAIYSFTNNGNQTCWASQRNIAKRAGCGVGSVKGCIKRLISLNLLEVFSSRTVRGGEVVEYTVKCSVDERLNSRSVQPLNESVQPVTTITNKRNNINTGISKITPSIIKEIAEKYKVTASDVEDKKEALELYCKSHDKSYKDYKAALMDWVRRDIKKGEIQTKGSIEQEIERKYHEL